MHSQHRRNQKFILTFFTSALLLLASACSSFANDLPTVIIDEDYPGMNGSTLLFSGHKTIHGNVVLSSHCSISIGKGESLTITGDLTIEPSAQVYIRSGENQLVVEGDLTLSSGGTISADEDHIDDSLIVNGNFTLDGKMEDLNIMEVGGNFYINNSLTLKNGTWKTLYTIKGDVIHSKGTFNLLSNMEVFGDYRAQQQVDGEWKAADVQLKTWESLFYSEVKLIVHGSFIAQTTMYYSQPQRSNATLTVKKDFTVLGDSKTNYVEYFKKVILKSDSLQKINYEPPRGTSYAVLHTLTIENSSEEGLYFENPDCDLDLYTSGSVHIRNLTNPKGKISGKAYFVGDMNVDSFKGSECDVNIEGNVNVTGSLVSDDINVTGDVTMEEGSSVVHYGNVTIGGDFIAQKDATIKLSHSEADVLTGNNKFTVNGNIILAENITFLNSNTDITLANNIQSKSPLTVKSLKLIGELSRQANIKAPAFSFQKFIHNCISYNFEVPNVQFSDSDGDGAPDNADFTPETAGQIEPPSICPAVVADFDNDGWGDLQELQTFGTIDKNPNDDFDNDGMPNKWEEEHGLNASESDGNGDLDNDGMTNLEEFTANSDPTVINIGSNYPGMENGTVTLSGTINRSIIIESNCTLSIPANAQLEINGDLVVEENATIAAQQGETTALVVNGVATIKGSASSPVRTTINGDLHIHEGAALTAPLNKPSRLTIANSAIVKGAINHFTTISVGNDLTIEPSGKLNENVSVQTQLTVYGSVINKGQLTSLAATAITGNLHIHKGASVTGASDTPSTLSASSYAIVEGTISGFETITVDNDLTIESTGKINEDSSVQTQLTVHSNVINKGQINQLATTTIDGDLHIYEGATFAGAPSITSPLVVSKNATIEGAITYFTPITIGEDLTIGQTGQLNNGSSAQNELIVHKDLINNGQINHLTTTTVDGNFTNTGRIFQLGTATIAQDFTTSNEFIVPSWKTVTVNGDFTQNGGTLTLGGTLNVLGNFTANDESTFEATHKNAKLSISGITTVNVTKDSEIESTEQAILEVKNNLSVLNKSYFYKSIKELYIDAINTLTINYLPSFYGKKLSIKTSGKSVNLKKFAPVQQLDFWVYSPSSGTPSYAGISGINFSAKLLRNTYLGRDVTFKNLDLAHYDLHVYGDLNITESLTYNNPYTNSLVKVRTGNLTFTDEATAVLGDNIRFEVDWRFYTKENADITFGECSIKTQSMFLDSKVSFIDGKAKLDLSEDFISSKQQNNTFHIDEIKLYGEYAAGDLKIKDPLHVNKLIVNARQFVSKTSPHIIEAPSLTIDKFLHNCRPLLFKVDPAKLTFNDSDLDGILDNKDAFPENDALFNATSLCLAVTSDFDKDGLNDLVEIRKFGNTNQSGTDDYDSDGLPNAWEIDNNLSPTSSSDANSDPDNDGFTNLEEYNAHTDPNDAENFPNVIVFVEPTAETPIPLGTKQTISWTNIKPIDNNIELQYSVNSGNTWHPLASVSDTDSYEWTVHPDALSNQFRLKITGSNGSKAYSTITEDLRVIASTPQSRDFNDWKPNDSSKFVETTLNGRSARSLTFSSTGEGAAPSTEIVQKTNGNTTVYQYGKFEGRLQAAPCASGESITSSMFTYWMEPSDLNKNQKTDASCIAISLLGHDPSKILLTVLTGEVTPNLEAYQKGQRMAQYSVNMRTGQVDRYVSFWNSFSPSHMLDDSFRLADFNSTTQSYVYGFDWKEDYIEWYIYVRDKKIVLARLTTDKNIPKDPAEFFTNVSHYSDNYIGLTDISDGLSAPASPTSLFINWLSSPIPVFDSDNDGLLDAFEIEQLGSCYYGANDDPDNDSLTNIQEYENGTNASLADSDHDGMPDGWEVAYNLNPLANDADEDPDGDSLTNLQEFNNGSDPGNTDGNVSDKVNITPVINFLLLN